MRMLLLILLNLSLPFLIFALRNWLWRWQLTRQGKPHDPIPTLDRRRVVKFLGIGVVCLLLSLGYLRLTTPTDAPFHGRPTVSGDY